MLFAAVRRLRLAQSGHSRHCKFCPLLDQSGLSRATLLASVIGSRLYISFQFGRASTPKGSRVMNLTVTDRISSQLHALLPKPCVNERPFVCDGLPADCVVMVVGENPGMRLETDWWTFWDDASGFDFQNFHLVFEAKRKSENKQLRAFWRLKRLRETGLRCLESVRRLQR
jgi:hypothetical protein